MKAPPAGQGPKNEISTAANSKINTQLTAGTSNAAAQITQQQVPEYQENAPEDNIDMRDES